MSYFSDRRHAGRILASALSGYAGHGELVVLALPRGGVPVAFEVAGTLRAPLDVLLVRKLCVPGHEPLAMGALSSAGFCVLNQNVVRALGLTKRDILDAARTERRELARQDRAFRGGDTAVDVSGKAVVVVDDGLTDGGTLRVAIRALRQLGPARVVGAVPIAAPDTWTELSDEVDDAVCARAPESFQAVDLWYQEFAQTSDDEVHDLLQVARRAPLLKPDSSAPLR